MIKTNEDLIRDLAKEYNLPLFITTQIINSPFKFLKETMAKKEFEGVMFPYLGKFVVPESTKKYLTKYLSEKNKRNIKGSTQQDLEQGRGVSQEEEGNL